MENTDKRKKLKFLVFSDLHEEEVALEELKKLEKKEKPDYVLVCGDSSQTYDFSERLLENFPNCLLIPGNWETKAINEFFSTKKCWMQEKRIEIENGYNIVGFGYSSPTPFGTYGELRDEKIFERLSQLKIDEKTILMLHCPPKGHFDLSNGGKHAGSESILKVIQEKQPFVAFFGHMHEHMGTKKMGKTLLIKLPAATNMGALVFEVEVDGKYEAKYISLSSVI